MFIKLCKSKKAQTTAEYAILIALVVAAVAAMQVYIKRGLSGQMKGAVDGLSATGISTSDPQYEPQYSASTGSTTQDVNETTTWAQDGAISTSGGTTVSGSRTQQVTQ